MYSRNPTGFSAQMGTNIKIRVIIWFQLPQSPGIWNHDLAHSRMGKHLDPHADVPYFSWVQNQGFVEDIAKLLVIKVSSYL